MTHHQLRQQGYLSVSEFAEKHNISVNTVYTHRNQTHDKYIINTQYGVYVNEQALQRRRDFHLRVWQEACDNYYELIDGSNQWLLSRVCALYFFDAKDKTTIGKWSQFFDKGLFSMAFMDKPLIHYKVSNILWNFWRFSKWLIRRLSKRQTAIYNRLPKRDNYIKIYKERGCLR